jgi:hypothetical protein
VTPHIIYIYISVSMVLESVKERGIEYLKSRGLASDDIGRVIGIFFFAKYITFLSMIPLCLKVRPLRRMLKPISAEGKAYIASRRTRFQQSRVATTITAKSKGYGEWFRSSRARERMQQLQREAKQFVAKKKDEQRQKLRERIEAQRQGMDPSGWSARIYNWTEKVANRVAGNEKWQTVAKSLKVPPKEFALAVGEGLVFYKLTSPIWMPLELWGIVKYLQWRRRRLEKENIQ